MIALALALLAVVFAPIDHPWTAAPLLAIWPPLLTSDALDGLVFLVLWCTLMWTVLRMARKEQRLNALGETLFPGLKRFDRRKIRTNTDTALYHAIRDLVAGDDPAGIAERLHEETHRGDALPDGRARLFYDMAVDRLVEAAGRDEVLDWSARLWALKDAETSLWAARAEYLSWMVE